MNSDRFDARGDVERRLTAVAATAASLGIPREAALQGVKDAYRWVESLAVQSPDQAIAAPNREG